MREPREEYDKKAWQQNQESVAGCESHPRTRTDGVHSSEADATTNVRGERRGDEQPLALQLTVT